MRGMRVSLRRNVNVSDRLANGSLGTVVGWTSDKKHRGMPDYVFVDFDCPSDKIVGRATRDEFIRNQSDPDTVKTFKRFGPNVVQSLPSPPPSSLKARSSSSSELSIRSALLSPQPSTGSINMPFVLSRFQSCKLDVIL